MSKKKEEEKPDPIELLDLTHQLSYDRGITLGTLYGQHTKHIKTKQRSEREMLSAACEFLRDKATEAFLSGEDEAALGLRAASEVLGSLYINTELGAEISFELVHALSSVYGASNGKSESDPVEL